MNNVMKSIVTGLAICLLMSCSKASKLKEIAQEEGVATATGWGVDTLLQYLDVDYLLTKMEENRVHSATTGKGISLTLVNWQSNVVIHAEPLDTVGEKRRIFADNYLKPGTYVFTSAIGSASKTLTLNKNARFDFFELTKALQADVTKGRGRLALNITPEDARVILFGTPEKYHKGIKLPEGEYTVKVTKSGYQDATIKLLIKDDKLTTESISLQRLQAAEAQPQVERIAVTGSKNGDWREVKVETGELVITPQRDDIAFTIVAASGDVYQNSPSLKLPAGDYRVTAKMVATGELLETKSVRIRGEQRHTVNFSVPKPVTATELPVTLMFKTSQFNRQRVEITLTPTEGDKIRFRERMGRNGLDLDMELMAGEYEAELVAKGVKYELGTIRIASDKSNKFQFLLD